VAGRTAGIRIADGAAPVRQIVEVTSCAPETSRLLE